MADSGCRSPIRLRLMIEYNLLPNITKRYFECHSKSVFARSHTTGEDPVKRRARLVTSRTIKLQDFFSFE
jgi:hypothetical protein